MATKHSYSDDSDDQFADACYDDKQAEKWEEEGRVKPKHPADGLPWRRIGNGRVLQRD